MRFDIAVGKVDNDLGNFTGHFLDDDGKGLATRSWAISGTERGVLGLLRFPEGNAVELEIVEGGVFTDEPCCETDLFNR